MLAINLTIFIVACIVLVLSGSYLVKSLSKIGAFLKWSEFIVAFIFVAVATSIPELFVAISSGIAHTSSLSLGNVIGANIIDLTIVIGIVILVGRGIKIESDKTKKDAFYMFLVICLPLILMLIGHGLSRLDGVILIVVFLLYSWNLIKQKEHFTKEVEIPIKRGEIVLNSFLFLASLALLFASSYFVVKYATALSIDLALPPFIIGLFLISFGTTLPELTFETKAVLSGHSQMALGDLIGTIIVNTTLVLGIAALIFPITIQINSFLIGAIFMMIIAFVFFSFFRTGNKLSIKEGIILILIYVIYAIVQFYVGG